MKRSTDWQGVPALIERLLDTADAGHRDRILLEAVARRPGVEALALWRPTTDGPEFGARWNQVLSRGPVALLPDREAVHAVVRGEHAPDFLPGLHLFPAGSGRGAFVLAVAGALAEEEEADLLEALLCLFAAIEGDEESERVEPWLPPLPATLDDRLEHDLRNVVTGMRMVQELLDEHGDALSDEERGRFDTMLGTECARAGDLLGSVLEPMVGTAAGDGACRPARVLRSLVRELSVEPGAALQVVLEDGALDAPSEGDDGLLRGALRGLLRALRSGCRRVHVAVERDAEGALVARLAAVELDEARGARCLRLAAEAETALKACGVRVRRDGGRWSLRFASRRAA